MRLNRSITGVATVHKFAYMNGVGFVIPVNSHSLTLSPPTTRWPTLVNQRRPDPDPILFHWSSEHSYPDPILFHWSSEHS